MKGARQANASADLLDRADRPHQADPKQGANNSKQKQKTHIGVRKSRVQHHLLHEFAACAKRLGNENAADCRRTDGGKNEGRIGPQNEFECVERASERRTECRADGTRRTTSDQRAHVAAAQPESHPEPRSNPRTHLRVGRFQSHRCAKTVRNHRLHGDERTLLEGHPAALQRIGFNGIDRPLRHPLLHIKPGNTENKTTHERHQRLDWRIERNQTAQLPVPEKPEMQQFRAPEQPGHAETGEGADARRKTNETHFVAPDEPAQLQGNAAYRFKLRNRLILWSQGAFGLRAALVPVISDLKRALTRRSSPGMGSAAVKHCIGAFSPL